MTISQAYKDFINQLKRIYPSGEALSIADLIFESTTQMPKWKFRESGEAIPSEYEKSLFQKLNELLTHKPVQYVLGESWFYKRKFYVDERVLIPRPETEELIEWIIADAKNTSANKPLDILEIGAGSGCIPVTIKLELPFTQLTSLDVSRDALTVAMKNAANLDAAIHFIQLDFLDENNWKVLGKYDIVVSNPPYIPFHQLPSMFKNVTDFEPGIALFVEDNDPLIFYKKIALFASVHLKTGGAIYVELNEKFASETEMIFKEQNFKTTIKKDIYGKERMIRALLT